MRHREIASESPHPPSHRGALYHHASRHQDKKVCNTSIWFASPPGMQCSAEDPLQARERDGRPSQRRIINNSTGHQERFATKIHKDPTLQCVANQVVLSYLQVLHELKGCCSQVVRDFFLRCFE